jgi:hypothetical protein
MMDRAKHHLGEADRFVNSAEEKRQAEIARRGINR